MDRSPSNYFEQVRRCAGLIPLNVFATANNRFSLDQASPDAHAALEAEMLSDSSRNRLSRRRSRHRKGPHTIVFTRAGSQLNLKLLLAVARPDSPYKPTAVGACALHANDYNESEDTSSLSSGLLPVVTEFAATWELQNPRQVGPLLRRSYYIYDQLLRTDQDLARLVRAELDTAIEDVEFAGLSYSKYFPLLFGFYAVAKNGVEKEATSIVDGFDIANKARICLPCV